MERKSVTSSNIKSIGHEGNILEVEFKNGKLYQYKGVSAEEHAAIHKAESIGSHIHKHIIKAGKIHTKIGG
jgi:hypothetical protein